MSIHQVIREGRLRLGLSEQQFAQSLGVSRGAVQHWEKSGGTAPQRKTQPRVAKLLGITVAELLTGISTMTSDPRIPTEVPVLADFQATPSKTVDNFANRNDMESVRVNIEVRRHTYAVRMNHASWTHAQQDVFADGTVVVVEPDVEAVPGDYVVVLDPGAKIPGVKQLVGAGREIYLRPLDRQIPASLRGTQPVLGVVCEAIRRFR